MEQSKSRLIIVSNRLPVKRVVRQGKVHFTESDGGLVSALNSYFDKTQENQFSETIWVGAADFTRKNWESYRSSGSAGAAYSIVPLFIEERTFNRYYNGFCNATIWPLFHYFPSFADFDSASFESYEAVNNLFKEKIVS